MNSDEQSHVLFLCTGNSARSCMAEAVLNRMAPDRYLAFSAGSHPKDAVHPQALRLLKHLDYDVSMLRPKSWDEFRSGPHFAHVITVCSNVAGETCPAMPGSPVRLHWEIPNPALAQGSQEEIAAAFRAVYDMLYERIEGFVRQS
jgi:protein-tyrosine-phosphatase